jgi:transposase
MRYPVTIGFAPMQISSGSASPELAVGGAIGIEFASGARMRITGAVDAATLAAAVVALAAGARR